MKNNCENDNYSKKLLFSFWDGMIDLAVDDCFFQPYLVCVIIPVGGSFLKVNEYYQWR